MSLETLANAKNKTVGTKETTKAVEKGIAKTVFIAEDADGMVVQRLIALAKEKAIPVVIGDTMINMGKACGIEVSCAAAAILEDE